MLSGQSTGFKSNGHWSLLGFEFYFRKKYFCKNIRGQGYHQRSVDLSAFHPATLGLIVEIMKINKKRPGSAHRFQKYHEGSNSTKRLGANVINVVQCGYSLSVTKLSVAYLAILC